MQQHHREGFHNYYTIITYILVISTIKIHLQNLEQLVHEQKRCRGLGDAKEGRYKPACRSEQALVNEAQKQRVTRTNLISVVESLRPDFPKLHSQLSSISASLKIIKISYTTDPTTNDEAQEQT
jgi:hypothetical protein